MCSPALAKSCQIVMTPLPKGRPPTKQRRASAATASGKVLATIGLISSPKLEQNLAAAIRLQGLFERFLELVERVHMLDCGGERSSSYEVSQLLVNLLDLCAGRVAYPIDEPESVEAKTTVDEVSGRHSWELPTLHGVDDNRAARFQRFGQLAHGSSSQHIEDEAEFLPLESFLNVLLQGVALENYA